MKDKFLAIRFLPNYTISMLFLVCALSFSQNVFGQKDRENLSTNEKPKLITESPYSGGEFESLNIDVLRNEIKRNTRSKGLIIFYCGKNCQYGEIEAHLRGINLSLRGKGIDKSDFLILNGGFREQFMIEYWLIPENACLPVPKATVDIKDVKFKNKYKAKVVAYDCCDDLP